jgi:predicted secreted Zn-dependent protease
MRRVAAMLGIAIALVAGACDSTATPTPSPAASAPAAIPSRGPAQPRTAAPTAPTILAVEPGKRPSGPWAITFQASGSDAVREVYVLTPSCPAATCDIEATIQTYDGIPLGTGVFRHADGQYRLDVTTNDKIDCQDGLGTVTDGAIQASHTTLVIAGYRSEGSAVVTVDIRGTRSVEIEPVAGSSCEAVSIDYVANGQATQFAAATAPPKPPTTAGSTDIPASYFGAGAKVLTYQVTGSSITQIISSIRANGPYSDWVKARAEAVTRAVPKYRYHVEGFGSACRIVIENRPAILFTYTITLPRWSRPKGVDPLTASWWAAEIQRVAAHERHHVELFREGATRLSSTLSKSTCANVTARLAAVAREIAIEQCEFDLKEYGTALGLSLDSCVNQ